MAWYKNTISGFLNEQDSEIFAKLNAASENFAIMPQQKDAWIEEIKLMKDALAYVNEEGKIYFEYEFPRIGRRADVVVVAGGCLYCFEFKVQISSEEEQSFLTVSKDQALDYAFDFADFNSKSHLCPIVPFLVVTNAPSCGNHELELLDGNVYKLICTNGKDFRTTFKRIYEGKKIGTLIVDVDDWERGDYEPTPTIVQAAERLFENHKVEDISRSGTDVTATIKEVENVIKVARRDSKKVVCLVTGEPGAGKTLVGLKLATGSTQADAQSENNEVEHRVFLSGNLPLVQVLSGALTRDFYNQVLAYEKYLNEGDEEPLRKKAQDALLEYLNLEVKQGCKATHSSRKYYNNEHCTLIYNKRTKRRFSKALIRRFFEAKIQLVSRFRKQFNPENYASNMDITSALQGIRPPVERVVVFDEGQRAWDAAQIKKKDSKTCAFQVAHKMSEPEALLRYMALHKDWCVFVVLVGNGQDIHVGEAGIRQWYKTLANSKADALKDWQICYAPGGVVKTSDFDSFVAASGARINKLKGIDISKLHLKTSQREYRAPDFGAFVDGLLKGAANQTVLENTKKLLGKISAPIANGHESFFIRITHDLKLAKEWAASNGHGTERRYGLLASSKAVRLRHFGIYTSGQFFDQEAWFLDGKESANASYAMEIAATEFEIQGLEIDYTIVGWDGDFFYDEKLRSFVCRKFNVQKNVWQEVADDVPDDICDGKENETLADQEFESKDAKIQHLTNAYRVLLTRARQGMVIYIPVGEKDVTSNVSDENYAPTYRFLNEVIGIKELSAEDFS